MNIVRPLLLLWTGTHFCGSSEAASLPLPTVDCSIYQKYPVVAIPCPITYQPICGSDYITYGNECHLCTESLLETHDQSVRDRLLGPFLVKRVTQPLIIGREEALLQSAFDEEDTSTRDRQANEV
ncbi:hypothetical protein MC885_015119 [Smutsia gigantea]|nr:hypothetical protein MC885_015119 [Smutsia gigantea]